jgi:starch phosphorylase
LIFGWDFSHSTTRPTGPSGIHRRRAHPLPVLQDLTQGCLGRKGFCRMSLDTNSNFPVRTIAAPQVDLSDRAIAYFSMEIGLSRSLPTYSGGLGMLAGDTLRSAADTGAPLVAVSMVHRRGYFRQKLSAAGQQTETDVPWSPETMLPFAGECVTINMQGRDIKICAWRFDVVGVAGHIIPVFLLDTDIDGNDPYDRQLTDHLYGGDTYYRLCQETVLGLGGVKLLHKLGCAPAVYHMNEGHAALLTLGLLENELAGAALATATEENRLAVAKQCVFTTHTPVPAGHDQFGADQMYTVLGQERAECLERFGCMHNGLLNMTYIALRFSRWVNGVAMQHGKVSQEMFPDYHVEFVTNGVHAATWIAEPLQKLLDQEMPRWRHDNQYFRSIYGIKPARIANAHRLGKRKLIDLIESRTGEVFDETVLTLGFARRVATYKRASLLLTDPKRLAKIAQKIGGLQIVYSGKAHPADMLGKGLIKEVFDIAGRVHGNSLKIIYLENYDWELGATLTQGVDVWVNTPRRPYEASGTSGMKAALNGVPSLSILDGWWIEGCAEDVTGWAIEDGDDDAAEACSLYEKLEQRIAPMYARPNAWARMQQHCIAMNGSFFNTDRMLGQYFANAYFPQAPANEETPAAELKAESMLA